MHQFGIFIFVSPHLNEKGEFIGKLSGVHQLIKRLEEPAWKPQAQRQFGRGTVVVSELDQFDQEDSAAVGHRSHCRPESAPFTPVETPKRDECDNYQHIGSS